MVNRRADIKVLAQGEKPNLLGNFSEIIEKGAEMMGRCRPLV